MLASARCRAIALVLAVICVVATSVARADDPVANPPRALTDGEKMKFRELVKLMWKMQRHANPNETLNDALNPPGQPGSNTGYEPTERRPPFASGPTKITEALRHYLEMMRTNKLKVDPCKRGASATMKPGTKDDEVTLSGKFMAQWCDAMASTNDRVAAKFQMLASAANEIAHVYQIESAALTPAQWDPVRCAAERDSDCMSIKFLEYLEALLKAGTGNAHGSLAGIEAEGGAGPCLAKCLMELGVDTPEEIAAALADARAKLAHYRDRKMNLFENQISQMLSWRQLYYGRTYRSPLLLKIDSSMFAAMRILKAMYGNGAQVEFVVPNDGKQVVAFIVTVNKMSQVVIIVITRGADGSICVHVWTDTNSNGMPDTGPTTTAIPGFPFFGDVLPAPHDVALIHAATSRLQFNDTMLIHDVRNGSLAAMELSDEGNPTGQFRVMLRSNLIADPVLGNPSAGGFHTLERIDETTIPGIMRFTFLSRGEMNLLSPQGAVVGIYDPILNNGTFQPPTTIAQAFAPHNPTGVDSLPYSPTGLTVFANPFNALRLDSIGHGVVQTLTIASVNNTGQNSAGTPPINPGPDLYMLTNMATGETVPYAQGRSAEVVDTLDLQFSGGPDPDVLVLTAFPGRLSAFDGDDPGPAYRHMAEIALENPDPGVLNLPVDGPMPFPSVTHDAGDTFLMPVATSPLVAQTLVDLDGDGSADDAAVVARTEMMPQFVVYMVIDAGSPAPIWFPSIAIPIEPAGIEYPNLNADNRRDLRIHDALGGPSLCLVNQGMMGFFPIACPPECPADFNNSGSVSVQDIFDFLAAYFAGDPAADFNQSGAISVQDIFDFLAAYFAGC